MVDFKCHTDAEGPNGISQGLESSRRGDVGVPIALAKEAEAVKHRLPALLPAGCFPAPGVSRGGFALDRYTHTDTAPLPNPCPFLAQGTTACIVFPSKPTAFLTPGKQFVEENHPLLTQSKVGCQESIWV